MRQDHQLHLAIPRESSSHIARELQAPCFLLFPIHHFQFFLISLCDSISPLITMEGNPYNSTDLDSVLKTLSGLAPQSNSSISTPAGTSGITSRAESETKYSNPPRHAPAHPPRPASTPTVDPSTITTWPTALRYVMHTVMQNEETQLRIRGLIRSQHSHERQWWKGREALVQRQQARGDKKKELDAVLCVELFALWLCSLFPV